MVADWGGGGGGRGCASDGVDGGKVDQGTQKEFAGRGSE